MNERDVKKDRYREAYTRIDNSIESEHYFEAITIVESILCDRITSFLKSTETLSGDSINRKGFALLITLWKLAVKNPGSIWDDCTLLIEQTDKWRKERNKYVHGLVKFPNQKAALVTTKEFIMGAKEAAEGGRNLAKLVGKWRKKQIAIKSAYTRKHKSFNKDALR